MADPGTPRQAADVQILDTIFREKWFNDRIVSANAENTQLKSKIDEISSEAEQSQLKQVSNVQRGLHR
jgi:hypothetical protein